MPTAQRARSESAMLARARKMTLRSKAAVVCIPCKTNKARCGDTRPCARYQKSGRQAHSDACSQQMPTAASFSVASVHHVTTDPDFMQASNTRANSFGGCAEPFRDECAEGEMPMQMKGSVPCSVDSWKHAYAPLWANSSPEGQVKQDSGIYGEGKKLKRQL